MKRWRLFLLVVLAVLLPLRGALAAAVLSAPTLGPAAGMAGAAMDEVGAAMPCHDADASTHAPCHDGTSAGGACALCAAFCSMLPLTGALPRLPSPDLRGTVAFAAPLAPVLKFQPEGLERPPRKR